MLLSLFIALCNIVQVSSLCYSGIIFMSMFSLLTREVVRTGILPVIFAIASSDLIS